MISGGLRLNYLTARRLAQTSHLPPKQQWQFFDEQKEVLGSDKRWLMVPGGVGAGKSFLAAEFLLGEILLKEFDEQNGGRQGERVYWIAGDSYKLCRREFEFLLNELKKDYGPYKNWASSIVQPQNAGWSVTMRNGVRVTMASWTNPESLQAEELSGLVIAECGQLPNEDVWTDLINRGRGIDDFWCFLCGTWEDAGETMKKVYQFAQADPEEWCVVNIPSWKNISKFKSGENSQSIRRAKKVMSYEAYMEKYGAALRSAKNLIYPEFDDRYHVGEYPVLPNHPTYLWIDPGTWVYCVLVAQRVEGKLRLVDEIYENHKTTEGIIAIAKQRPWWKDVTNARIDLRAPEAKATWYRLTDGKFSILAKDVPRQAGADLVKSYLFSGDIQPGDKVFCRDCHEDAEHHPPDHPPTWGASKIFFDSSCVNTIRTLKALRYDQSGNIPLRAEDHAADALKYGLAEWFTPHIAPRWVDMFDAYAPIRPHMVEKRA